ncbi:hypothetical protein BDZ90DRAFT_89015 [Jaminaea rosea]|uniref:Secreted protein n=1 Tax=Jaminaea rosea TaxID=1569628 RepID=A0A316UKM2_9BASI|nr:hypothetical protein BDZ90DRAFT_89015 [Jaminaea rosea]PWN24921.1 hypothetical protein BDZ90DRAFT_89015 [Jaminaea rosea]
MRDLILSNVLSSVPAALSFFLAVVRSTSTATAIAVNKTSLGDAVSLIDWRNYAPRKCIFSNYHCLTVENYDGDFGFTKLNCQVSLTYEANVNSKLFTKASSPQFHTN